MQQENILQQLQKYLKKQWLLVEKQQQQKKKLKNLIEDNIKLYYSQYVSTIKYNGKITNDQKLENCYNFIKQIFLTICKDIQLGTLIIIDTKISQQLKQAIISLLYQNISQNDYYKKPISMLIKRLIQRIILENKNNYQFFLQKLQKIFKIFFKRNEIQEYFNMVTNPTITRIMKMNFYKDTIKNRRGHAYSQVEVSEGEQILFSLPSTSFSEASQYSRISIYEQYQSISEIKKEIVNKYLQDILEESQSCPIQLKLTLKLLYQTLKTNQFNDDLIYELMWKVVRDCYLNPINIMKGHLLYRLSDQSRKNIFEDLSQHFLQHINNSKQYRINLLKKLAYTNQNKYNQFLIASQKQTNNITTYAVCMNYQQTYHLFTLIKDNQNIFKQNYPKMINRLNKVYQMSHNLDILKKQQPGQTYLLFTQIMLNKTLQLDYHKIYSDNYKDSMIKTLIRQVLVELMEIQSNIYSNTLQKMLENIINRHQPNLNSDVIFEMNNLTISTGVLIKIKYLVWLLKNNKTKQSDILVEMLKQTKQRIKQNIEIYEKVKFSLFKTISNIKNKITILINQKLKQLSIINYLKYIQIIQLVPINLCITSPYSRKYQFCKNSSLKIQQQDTQINNFLKYRISSSNQIIISNTQFCIHKQNILLGLDKHSDSIKKFIKLFCQLKQVRQSIQNGKDKVGIKVSIYQFIQQVKKICQLSYNFNPLQLKQFNKVLINVVMKSIHKQLIENNSTNQDRQFYNKLDTLKFFKSKHLSIPAQCNIQQIWQMCSRYILQLSDKKTPQLKIEALKEIIDTLRIVLYYQQDIQQSISKILIYLIIRAKPKTLISNINFIELFLPQNKLLSTQGEILALIKIIINKIINNQFENCFNLSYSSVQIQISTGQFDSQLRQSKSLRYEY